MINQEEKFKILIAHNYYQIAGGEDSVVQNERKMLENNGHHVSVYTRSNLEIKEFSLAKKILLPFSSIFSFKTYRDVKRIIRREQIDILHVHNTLSLISPSIYYAAFSCGIPVIQTIHNFRLICPNALLYRSGHICEDCLQKGLKCAIKHKCYRDSLVQTLISVCVLKVHRILKTYRKINYICLTQFNKEKLLSLQQIRPESIFIKSNFSESNKSIIPYEHRKQQFLFVGRPEKIKGIQVLLEAWKQIKQYDLIICGTSKELDWCRSYVQEYKLKNVYILGKIGQDRVSDFMRESLALILPTQVYEGFPMTIVEAFSYGTPVIGSNIGNVGQLIKNGIDGLLFQFDSPVDLRNKVYMGFEQDVVKNCFSRYEEMYNEKSNYTILQKIYANINR